jgi:hypothetical protein
MVTMDWISEEDTQKEMRKGFKCFTSNNYQNRKENNNVES